MIQPTWSLPWVRTAHRERRPLLRSIGARAAAGELALANNPTIENDVFVWRAGRSEVTLQRSGETWWVQYTSVGRLLGPRQQLYSGKHRRASLAAWDVMARVIRASGDEEEGVRVARAAAHWMRQTGHPDADEE